MANYYEARIPLERVHEIFGHTKIYPEKLLMTEVENCEFCILDDGTAEIFWQVRTDYDGTARLLPPGGPHVQFSWLIPKDAVLDCIVHAGIGDVEGGSGSEVVVIGEGCYDVTEDLVKNICYKSSGELIVSYICLFGIKDLT